MKVLVIDLELEENPTLERAQAYIEQFGPSLEQPAPQHIIDILGGQEKFDIKMQLIALEIERLINLYPQLGD